MVENKNNEKLQFCADHVQYEINMLIYSFKSIQKALSNYDDKLKKMSIETFLIHSRNLIDFLYDKSISKDDVLSKHYIDDKKGWDNTRGKLEGYLDEVRNNVNKYLAHITSKRMARLQWNFSRILKELSDILNLFIRQLPEKRREWFDISGLAVIVNSEIDIVDGTWSSEGTWRGN